MLRAISFLLLGPIAILLPAAGASPVGDSPSRARTDERQVWNLEKAYWDYVKANDLGKYRGLWHERFVGWPSSSSKPLGKDHITDWITRSTAKGLKLQSYAIKRLAIQVTGDIAVTHYRVKMLWTGPKPGDHETELSRIHHTWIRTGNTFQIIGGMSAPVNAEGQ